MSEQAPSNGGFQSAAPSAPAAPPPEHSQPAAATPPQNPRSVGHSPARASRAAQQQQPPAGPGQQGQDGEQGAAPQTLRIGGVEYTADQVNDALRFKSEQEIRTRSLPPSADGYEVKLPDNFELPHDVKWEFDRNSAELKNFQRLAHARGLDQEAFSEALGIYAAANNSAPRRSSTRTARSSAPRPMLASIRSTSGLRPWWAIRRNR